MSFMVDVNVLREKPTETQSSDESSKEGLKSSSISKETNLYEICRSGNVKRVEEAIAMGMDVNVRGTSCQKVT